MKAKRTLCVKHMKYQKKKQYITKNSKNNNKKKSHLWQQLENLFFIIAMNDLKNQASKIKQEQEKQLDEIIKKSVEQKSASEVINTHEKKKRKLEEELSGIDLTEDIQYIFIR